MDRSLPKHDKPIKNRKIWNFINNLPLERPSKFPHKVGNIGKVDIYLVDGDEVRYNFYMDFVYGGHDLVYGKDSEEYPELGFIPDKEIWIDGHIDRHEMIVSLYHEIIERKLMMKGMKYNRAHKIANLSEKAICDQHKNDGFPHEDILRIADSI